MAPCVQNFLWAANSMTFTVFKCYVRGGSKLGLPINLFSLPSFPFGVFRTQIADRRSYTVDIEIDPSPLPVDLHQCSCVGNLPAKEQ
mmetsp:Transcript_32334/g.59009  ORF Transcript_32334/g.59009 Transcript_32334/m.59009 type:complete len:87 (+) Transcript_32334:2-262(+)